VVRLDEDFHVEIANEKPCDVAAMRADAVLAMIGLGLKKRDASRVVAETLDEDRPGTWMR